MTERENTPWKISPEALELEFVRRSIKELATLARKFAVEHDITYEIDENAKDERLRILPSTGDFKLLRDYIESVVPRINELFETHSRSYVLDIREYNKGLHIEAIKK
jgi:hypothetical protein